MPGRLLRHNRIEYAAIAGYVVLVVVVAVTTSAKANVAILGKAAGQVRHASTPDLATIVGQALSASMDFIAAACMLLIAALIFYWRRRSKVTTGAARKQTVSRGGPPFLL